MMKIKYPSDKSKLNQEVEDPSFLLSNELGDYLWLSEKPRSRYQGWFFSPSHSQEEMIRVIEDIKPVDPEESEELINYFSKAERKRSELIESFWLDKAKHSLVYELNKEREIELFLDVRESYSNDYSEYDFEEVEEGLLLITANTDTPVYLAIQGYQDWDWIGDRFVRNYKLDEERNSPPFEKAVFKALNLKGKRFQFAVSHDRKKAINTVQSRATIENVERFKNEPVDFTAARVGLDNLCVENGIRAGFPWFFQFWTRDEAISLKGLNVIHEKRAKNIFWKLLERDPTNPKDKYIADGIGWVYKRAFIFLNQFNQEEKDKLLNYLSRDISFLLEERTQDKLAINDNNETWMDSISRKGARIEMQALRLIMYKLGTIIASDNAEHYKRLEKGLKERVREIFWNGEILADGYVPSQNQIDDTIRPNVFLAYYIYPEFLTSKEWKKCFQTALHELWLDWGGLATVSKQNPRFTNHHTGENAQSYHQGDSWFFINNLAAIAMNRVDDRRFSYEIKEILSASRENILYKGSVGHHSELSSAKELTAEGAVSQAWSFATYLEALHEIYKIENFNWS